MSKKDIIKKEIQHLIYSCKTADNKLPGERELAVMLKAGRNTIRAALSELAADGRIDRCRRRGTTVKFDRNQSNQPVAGLIMRTAGHYYSDLYKKIFAEFTSNDYKVQSVSAKIQQKYNKSKIANSIKKLFDENPAVLVISGESLSGLPYLNEIFCKHPILFDFNDSSVEKDFSGVWVDYRQAGYLAGKYLIEKGCRRPVFFSHYIPLNVRLNFKAYNYHREKMAIEGFRQAMTDGGIDPEPTIISSQSSSRTTHFKILNQLAACSQYLPDGFCGAADYIVIYFMRQLMEIYRKIPDEITFVGIGDTPWSKNPSIKPFASIGLNYSEIARTIVQQAQLEPESRENIYIQPTLRTI